MYDSSEELQGGELAARLSPQTRMAMIQLGYNPLSPADLNAYQKRQKPTEGLSEIAGVSKYKNLGDRGTFIDGKHIIYSDSKDYGIISKEGKGDLIDYDNPHVENVDPRMAVRDQMQEYGTFGRGESDINDRILNRLGDRREMHETSRPAPRKQNNNTTRGPIQAPKAIAQPQQQILTEAGKASKLGYAKGVKYINAFIDLIQNPTDNNRQALIEELNRMVTVEQKIHPKILAHYRSGLAAAERDLYKKLKGNA